MSVADNNKLKSKVLKLEDINWKQLEFIQQNDFKQWENDGDKKLLESLVKYQFIDPFKVWQFDGKIFCLDGKHRYLDLLKAEEKGISVPKKLPAVFIDCKDVTEAAELVLIYSSRYAQISNTGFDAFVSQYNLNIDTILPMVNIPNLPITQMGGLEYPDELTADAKNKPATIKITFDSTKDLEQAESEIKLLLGKYPKAFYSVSFGEI